MTTQQSIEYVDRLQEQGFDLEDWESLKYRESMGLTRDEWVRLHHYDAILDTTKEII